MTTLAFYRTVIEETGQTNRAAVKQGVAAVLGALRDRLTPGESRQAAAQLPRELKAVWLAGEIAGRKPVKMHRQGFYERVKKDAGLKSIKEARFLVIAVFAALKEQLSPGEVEDVQSQLPKDLKEIWEDA
jgi:uncharacterized protein (DUF2267 family)